MNTIIIKGTEYKIPTTLQDITWKQFVDFYKLKDETHFKIAKIIAVMIPELTYDDVINTDTPVIMNLFGQLSFLYNSIEELTKDMTSEIKVGEDVFYINDLTIFKEFATYASVEQRFTDSYDAIPYQLAYLVRKADETTDVIKDEVLQERATMFLNQPAEEVIKLHNFFLFRSETLLTATEAFSQPLIQMEQLKESWLENLLMTMDGLEQPQNWLKKTLRNWIKYLIKKQMMYYGF